MAWVICGFLKDVSAGALQLNNRSLTRCLKSAIRSARLGTHTRLATKFERFPALITSGVLGHVWKKHCANEKDMTYNVHLVRNSSGTFKFFFLGHF